MSDTSVLLVPIHLDALLLKHDQPTVAATADFTHLPYTDTTHDVNPDTPNISESIVAHPFQDQDRSLRRGIHLHWSLPDALTKGTSAPTGTTFPAVPNRWLVTRSIRTEDGQQTIEKRWVIESDYLYPDGEGSQADAISYPFPSDPKNKKFQPFRYLGRKLPLRSWQPYDPQAEYIERLTAVGYGEPTFAALYPNCHSVFGFHDNDYVDHIPPGLQYDVLGWYSDGEHDHLKTFIDDFSSRYQAENHRRPAAADVKAAIEEVLRWHLEIEPEQVLPDQLLCYARLTVDLTRDFSDLSSSTIANPALDDSEISIAIGNTGTEALSAYLASMVSPRRKAEVEDQLEALLLAARLDQRQLDLGAKFKEARHEKGFTAISGGVLWIIRPEPTADRPADATHSDEQSHITLPDELTHQLNQVNTLQHTFDRSTEAIESLRRQLFADWYKYMLCQYPAPGTGNDYPDIDEVRHYIEQRGIAPLQNALATTDVARIQLQRAIDQLAGMVATFNTRPEVQRAQTTYTLKPTSAPRYWQPNNPVVLIVGAAAQPTHRHGRDGRLREDGRLACQVLLDAAVADLIPDGLTRLGSHIDQLYTSANDEQIGFHIWSQQPWNPISLEWEVEVFPIRAGSNLQPETPHYSTDFMRRTYQLAEDEPDLGLRDGQGAVQKAANVYSGSSILTPYAGRQLAEQLREHLKPSPQAPSDLYRQIYDIITTPGFGCLSQSLGAFNEALLMRRQVMQLDIADPLGFAEYQHFTETVRQLVGKSNWSAPHPANDFNPIRSGAMKIRHLRLVDTFGQIKDLACDRIIAAEELTVPTSPDWIWLPPRLTQPARLNVRWLSASQGDLEMSDDPATTPICGWVLPNNLDTSLMIYDHQGHALGVITPGSGAQVAWLPAPGHTDAPDADAIPNPHLRTMVRYLTERGPAFLINFLATLNTALTNIDPETSAQQQDLAILMGRPIALVRAALNLELQGLPAVHQSWNAFRQDLRRKTRDTDSFTQVEFPIRIGDYRQLNDGLVGYWKETGDGYENTFYAPHGTTIVDSAIVSHTAGELTIHQSVDAPPQLLSMLIDPRGAVHFTSGILPVKAIDIPAAHYLPALQAIEITFLTAPILSDLGQINLPLPELAGYQWSWLQRDQEARWTEISGVPMIEHAAFQAALAQRIWDRLVQIGWLATTADTDVQARLVAVDNRAAANLGDEFTQLQDEIEQLLVRLTTAESIIPRYQFFEHIAATIAQPLWKHLLSTEVGWLQTSPTSPEQATVLEQRQGTATNQRMLPPLSGRYAGLESILVTIFDRVEVKINPVSLQAYFSAPQEIREGWLKLRLAVQSSRPPQTEPTA